MQVVWSRQERALTVLADHLVAGWTQVDNMHGAVWVGERRGHLLHGKKRNKQAGQGWAWNGK